MSEILSKEAEKMLLGLSIIRVDGDAIILSDGRAIYLDDEEISILNESAEG